MEELLKRLLDEIKDLRFEMNSRFDQLEKKEDAYHLESIEADNKLLEAIQQTNFRLDFQRDKLIKTEEEVFLLKRNQ